MRSTYKKSKAKNQTFQQDVESMLAYCWPTVFDVGPTINQQWINLLCLLGTGLDTFRLRKSETNADFIWSYVPGFQILLCGNEQHFSFD